MNDRNETQPLTEAEVLEMSGLIQGQVKAACRGVPPAVALHALAAVYYQVATGNVALHASFPVGTVVPSALPTLLTVKDALVAAFRAELGQRDVAH